MRLAYLDEAGTSRKEPALAVAGVIIDGDTQVMEVEKRIDLLRQRHIPEADWNKVILHATDIYHGKKYFDRRKPEWADDWKRWMILVELAGIIESLQLPIVTGIFAKENFGVGRFSDEVLAALTDDSFKKIVVHGFAAVECVIWTERWLERFAPEEQAVIVAEDNDYIKRPLKEIIRHLRNERLLKLAGFDGETTKKLGLPLKRIVDTPHFAAKQDAAALQLADLVAFTLGRLTKKKPTIKVVSSVLENRLRWLKIVRDQASSDGQAQ